jgi:hypothetical protein
VSLSTSGGRARRWNCDWEMEEFGHELMEMEIDDLDVQATRTLTLLRDLLVVVSDSQRILLTWSTFTPARYAPFAQVGG